MATTMQMQPDASAVDPSAYWRNPSLRLARRITYALTESDARAVRIKGGNAFLEQQLAYEKINDSLVDHFVATSYPNIFKTAEQISNLTDSYQAQLDFINATIYRAAFSKRQLFHRMVEFWTDHFNIYLDKTPVYLKAPDDIRVIRKNALGFFPQMLWDSAHSPAMLQYLDNADSNNGDPNQNYARELMELHTLGVNGGYTQQDVVEVARCFTGWTIQYDNTQPGYLEFIFDPNSHDDGDKTVLGVKIPGGGGVKDGETVLKILGSHPSTAHFVSRKMILFFMGVEPSAAYLNSVANVYLQTGGDIRAMIRAIFAADVTKTPAKFKRPFHFVAGLLRQINAQGISDLTFLQYGVLSNLGQIPFDWAPPNGYPDKIGYWSGNMLDRWNFATDVAEGNTGTLTFDPDAALNLLLHGNPTPVSVAFALDNLFTMGEMSPLDRNDLIAFLNAQSNTSRNSEACALALSCPSYQYY